MPVDLIMPALGMAQDTGKVIRWLKPEGATVQKGEPLVEVETDKVTVDIEAPADGTLAGVRASAGDEIPVGQAIAVVLVGGEELPLAGAPSAIPPVESAAADGTPRRAASDDTPGRSAPSRRLRASPKARRLAAARGIDIESLTGSGPAGALLAADVETALERAVQATGPRPPLETGGTTRVWRVMAERTARSWQTVPHIWLRRDAQATELQNWLESARATSAERVSMTDVLVKVSAHALRRHPRVNSSWDGGAIVPGSGINVAIAVATDDALVAPVIHGADALSLAEIASRRAAVVTAARDGRLRIEDLEGGTFTISNLGMYGVDAFDGIVNAPQAALLAVGRIRDQCVPISGGLVVRPILSLSLALDHRVVDGARGAEFLDTIASTIESPGELAR